MQEQSPRAAKEEGRQSSPQGGRSQGFLGVLKGRKDLVGEGQ